MAVAVEKDVRAVISAERENKIHRAHIKAWKDWWDDPKRLDYSYWKRTRACMLFERLRFHLTYEFKDDKGAKFSFKNETFKIVFDDKVMVRFKKAGGRGMGSNVQTQTVMNFCEQQEDLPGVPGLQKVEIVHNLNRIETAIGGISVLARDGSMKLWAYGLNAIEEPVTILSLPPRPIQETNIEDLVIPRENKSKEKPETKE